jgi:hypothetical protein
LQFASGAVQKAGEDAWDAYRAGGWRGLRRLADEIAAARTGDHGGTVTIRDPDGPDVHLSSSVPDIALEELADLDWSGMRDGWLTWDAATEQWMYLGGGESRAKPARRSPK